LSKKLIVPYVREESNLFSNIRRPKLKLSLYSKFMKCWIKIDDVLADTGADISILPENLGILLLGNYKVGPKYEITGLLPDNISSMYIHRLSVKIGSKNIRTDFAIAGSNNVPPTLGRMGGLDKFCIHYRRGRDMVISF